MTFNKCVFFSFYGRTYFKVLSYTVCTGFQLWFKVGSGSGPKWTAFATLGFTFRSKLVVFEMLVGFTYGHLIQFKGEAFLFQVLNRK